MSTLKETLYQTMRDDDVALVGLQALLGKSSTPYGIYYRDPPKEPSFPIITYFINAQTGDWPRMIPVMVTAWSNTEEKFILVLDRVYTLFQDKTLTPSDYGHVLLALEGTGSEMFDDQFKVWYRQDRFMATGVRKI